MQYLKQHTNRVIQVKGAAPLSNPEGSGLGFRGRGPRTPPGREVFSPDRVLEGQALENPWSVTV
ncbi:hypothetical protein FMUAM8_26070 [Nocardia cyriacigeorgica]|nr:hypothetical protein FMUAM8_26070 [Nocardia cyriacigeorgica]